MIGIPCIVKTLKQRKVKLLKFLLMGTFFLGYNTINAQEFTIYNSWDFENEDVGRYTDAEISEDFKYFSGRLYSHNSADIVIDTINNTATKVMRITHPANTLSNGFEMFVNLQNEYDELYLSYNWKFSDEFNSTAGGKLSGFVGSPINSALTCPGSGQGFWAINMFKYAGSMISYHYDRTSSSCPWAYENYKYNKIFFNNGCWYNITQRLVMNTFTNGVANADGIKELWVDGRLIFQLTNLKLMQDESNSMKIDGFALSNFYGGSGEKYMSLYECYGYIDNITVYMPGNDSISGYETHSPSTILPTPDEITDRTVYYDSLITTEGSFSNTEYGSPYSACIDEAYLVDAGEGNTVTVEITGGGLGAGDYLFFYDGNTTDANLIQKVEGAASGIRKSTGRYMFVRFSADRLQTGSGWSGTISFSPATSILEKKTEYGSSGKIKILPNPGTNKVTIQGIQNKAELSVFDMLGRKVLYKKSVENNEQINVSDLPVGNYTVMLTNNSRYILRFIKN